ncbi:MAG: methyltransferase domain-containing protein [Bacteroidetes bacterium]|nr:methyltransferase domain-containing protein [Bacteroidota bacterium]
MSFYDSISGYYREIFPLNPAQVPFVIGSFPRPAGLSLLDVGCGTGDLALKLSSSFGRVTGIDLDSAMLKIARVSAPGNTEFLNLNMLDLRMQFGDTAFNGVVCFGNTLVHLDGLKSITEFIQQARDLMNGDGKLLLQLINYDRILDQEVQALPTIETDNCRFQRDYHYNQKLHRIVFETSLTIVPTGQSIRNKILLYPLRKEELHSILSSAGFTSISYYGNFKREPLEEGSIPMVVEASIGSSLGAL